MFYRLTVIMVVWGCFVFNEGSVRIRRALFLLRRMRRRWESMVIFRFRFIRERQILRFHYMR